MGDTKRLALTFQASSAGETSDSLALSIVCLSALLRGGNITKLEFSR